MCICWNEWTSNGNALTLREYIEGNWENSPWNYYTFAQNHGTYADRPQNTVENAFVESNDKMLWKCLSFDRFVHYGIFVCCMLLMCWIAVHSFFLVVTQHDTIWIREPCTFDRKYRHLNYFNDFWIIRSVIIRCSMICVHELHFLQRLHVTVLDVRLLLSAADCCSCFWGHSVLLSLAVSPNFKCGYKPNAMFETLHGSSLFQRFSKLIQ